MSKAKSYKDLLVWQRAMDVLVSVSIALGSQGELETQLEASRRLRFCTETELTPVVDAAEEVGRMLNGLAESLEHRIGSPQRVFSYRAPSP